MTATAWKVDALLVKVLLVIKRNYSIKTMLILKNKTQNGKVKFSS